MNTFTVQQHGFSLLGYVHTLFLGRQNQSTLLLWRYAAFDSHFLWIILFPCEEETPQELREVRRVEWRRSEDDVVSRLVVRGMCCRLRPAPTLYLRYARVPRLSLISLLEDIKRISSLQEKELSGAGMSIDGESWGIEYTTNAPCEEHTFRYEWWTDTPDAWPRALANIRHLHTFLETYLEWGD